MRRRGSRAAELPKWLRSALGELRRFQGPVPVDHALNAAGMASWRIVQAIDTAAIAAARAGVTGGDYTAAHWRTWAIACMRESDWRRAQYRCGPVGGPYSYHPLGEAWPGSDECC